MCGSLPVTKLLEEEGGGEKRQVLCFAPTETGVKAHTNAGLSDPLVISGSASGWRKDWPGTQGLVPGLVSATPSMILGTRVTTVSSHFPFVTGNIDPCFPSLSYNWKITQGNIHQSAL